ncbi:TIGR03084 family metal-binding protein [Streptomyces sp. NPDC047002]|uniref:TIGR03084 family metal-binding protein n=1 Tax=Streptomyces sp. NPDC047002 TaxID=3155475 RepID=UPI003454C0EB
MTEMRDVFTDLVTEGDELDAIVAGLTPEEWEIETPSPGWTVTHQVAHLAFIAHLARTAATDAEGFQRLANAAKGDFQAAVDGMLAAYMKDSAPHILERWRVERTAADAALAEAGPDAIVPWLVNPLPASVLAAAGMMELYGHGQDVRDALGMVRVPSDRIGHLVFFATRTRDFGYLARGIEPPKEEFRFEVSAPSGQVWAFGPEDAEQRITGTAEDLCLLVARRRHRDDLGLVATGKEAEGWLDIAQAYRGPAGEGRRPGQFAAI